MKGVNGVLTKTNHPGEFCESKNLGSYLLAILFRREYERLFTYSTRFLSKKLVAKI